MVTHCRAFPWLWIWSVSSKSDTVQSLGVYRYQDALWTDGCIRYLVCYSIVVSTEATETGTRRETGSCRPKWSPIPTTAVTWIPVSEPRGKLSSGHLSGVGFGWYLARISLQLVPEVLVFVPTGCETWFCVFSVRFLRVFSAFFDLNFPQRVCSFQAPYWFCIFTFEVFLFLSCFSASFFIIRGVIGIFLFYWWGLCSFFCLFRGWKWVVSWPSSSRQLQSHVCSWEDSVSVDGLRGGFNIFPWGTVNRWHYTSAPWLCRQILSEKGKLFPH